MYRAGKLLLTRFDSIVPFDSKSKTFDSAFQAYGKSLYKHIRWVQKVIYFLRGHMKNIDNFFFLKHISPTIYNEIVSKISYETSYDVPDQKIRSTTNMFYVKLKRLCLSKAHIKRFNDFLKIRNAYYLNVEFPNNNSNIYFNAFLFFVYLKLFDLEEVLQYINWQFFRFKKDKQPFKYNKPKPISKLLSLIEIAGYST